MSSNSIVYIIDDDAALRDALDSLFRSTGLLTRAYESASRFLENPPDDNTPACIVTDVRMPGMNGLEFHERLEDFDMYFPVILMTGHGDIPMSVRSMKAGAIDFLPKPFRDQEMLDAVSVALRRDEERRCDALKVKALKGRFNTLSPRERQVMEGVVVPRQRP